MRAFDRTAFHRTIATLRLRLRSLFRRSRVEDELDEELRYHLERETAALVAEGRPPAEARAIARRAFGGPEQLKEACRDTRRVAPIDHVRQDLRYGARMLRRNPGFAATTILTVALGIGATTAIFSIVYGVLLRPLPYGEPERLATVWCGAPTKGYDRMFVSAALHRDWREQNQVFEDLALVRHIANFNLSGSRTGHSSGNQSGNMSGSRPASVSVESTTGPTGAGGGQGEPERVLGARVSPNLFRVLRVQPVLGRDFRDDEEELGRSRVVILSHALWQRRYAGNPDVLGTTLLLSGEPHVVIGVMGPDFTYPTREFALWKPLVIDPEELRTRTNHGFITVARLKPGVTFAQADADIGRVTAQIARQHKHEGLTGGVTPLMEEAIGPVRTPLYVLLGAVGCLLLIGCANLANLFFARGLGRRRELVVRAALGASRGRLMLQSLIELLPVLIAGGLLGLIAAVSILRLLLPMLPARMPRIEAIDVSGPVLAFSAGALLLTGLLAGLLPALHAARTDLSSSMKEDSRGSAGGRERARLRSLLVIGQVSTTIVLLIGAGLFLRSFARVSRVDPGFRTDHVLSLLLQVPRLNYETEEALTTFAHAIVDRVKAVPGVEAAGMVNRLPLGGVGQTGNLILEGSALPDQRIMAVEYRSATPDYFTVLRIPLIAGRFFTDADSATAPRVGLIDDRLARLAWPNQDPIGRRFRINFDGLPWITIVGVVSHIRHEGLDAESRMQVYWPLKQRAQDRLALVVRTRQEPKALAASVREAIRAVDPNQPAYDVQTMDEVVGQSLSYRWLNMMLLTVFAGVALLLATIGIYGVIAYTVGLRVREFGVRVALGAQQGDVVRLVLRQGATLAAMGVAIGVAAALLVSRVLEGLLYQVSARDALSFAAAPGLLFVAAIVASYIPARRAARRDPMRALRAE